MQQITIQTDINKPIDQVWDYFNNPKHIVNWNFAHESWECPSASNDLEIGGKLSARMQAKDGSFGFDFVGIYDEVKPNQTLKYHLEDGRKVEVIFEKLSDDKTRVTENFDPENQNPVEFQKNGWQAILDNFKNYSESLK
ncbi:SRPBCC family protein [Epilithonimonas sp. UC225_85]|uniref:SRPBCC family protein n=1 Tax=Epilithonimonas sp. UC225_85 TaxID=3350167 RepID=UPI0036D31310